MPRLPEKKVKLGRNDPCWCGSGKKYKDCHLPIEQAHRAEQLRLREAQDTLLPKIIAAAQSVPAAFPAAFVQFWQEQYTPEQMGELDDLEDRGAERFLTWFAFDYLQEDGRTLVAQLVAADSDGFALDEFEARLLREWQPARLRPYLVAAIRKGQGFTLRDMLDGGVYTVNDAGASKRLLEGEVVVGHIVPADRPFNAEAPNYYLAGAAAQLTADTAEKLVEFAELHLADLRRSHPEATWSDLLRERSHVLNHFVMALPREKPDPTVFDTILSEARVKLQMTGESLAGLVGRGRDAAPPDAASPAAERPAAPPDESA